LWFEKGLLVAIIDVAFTNIYSERLAKDKPVFRVNPKGER